MRLSNTLESDFCIAALGDDLSRYGMPEVCNTDQGCQFTSPGFIALLQKNNIRISMYGRGCWRDNIMVEWFWHSLKYENIYLHAYETGSEARHGINIWIDDYNQNQGYSCLADYTPDELYGGILLQVGPSPRLGKMKAA